MRGVTLVLLLSACAAAREGVVFTKPTALQVPGAPPVVVGNWQVDDDSHTIMEVTADAGSVRVRAYTPDEHVDFAVADVSWDGKRLKATFTYPPTGFVTKSDLELVDENTLEGPVEGGYQGFETWKRVRR